MMKIDTLFRKWKILSISFLGMVMMVIQIPSVQAAEDYSGDQILLELALHKISLKYDVHFNYDRNIMTDVMVDYEEDNAFSLAEALDHVFENTHFGYRIFEERYIVVFENNDDGTESLKNMINHMQDLVEERESVKKRIGQSVGRLSTLSAKNLYHKRFVFSVSGTVTDDGGEPLIGVNIQVKGSNKGTSTDFDGNFVLDDIDESAVLIISYIGYQTLEVSVAGKSTLEIVMTSDSQMLDEVVVIGYGTQKKSDLTGAISQVGSKELISYPTINPLQALSGRATGVQVIENDGSPGSSISVRIRGTNSINGDNEPLYVVDGFPLQGNPTMVNNNDIVSVDILKNASATAIYGSRGANGVVIITTKSGQQDGVSVNYEGGISVQTIRKKLDLMTPIQYGEFYNEMASNDGDNPYFSEEQLNSFKNMNGGTDWQSSILRSAPMFNNTLSVSGGTEKVHFYVSGGLLDQGGIIKNSHFKKYSLQTKIKNEINNMFSWELSLNAAKTNHRNAAGRGNQSATSGRGNSLFSGMIAMPPSLNPYNQDGSLKVPILEYPFIGNNMINPLNYIEFQQNDDNSNYILGNTAVNIDLFSGLVLRISGGIESLDSKADSYRSVDFVNSAGEGFIDNTRVLNLLNENTVTFDKSAGDSKINILGGFTFQSFKNYSSHISGADFINDVETTNNIGGASINNPATSSFTGSVLLSYLGRINYSFKEKYLLTASFRGDGSSRYTSGDKWGVFPSGAIAWNLSKENFLKDINMISDAKIRVGFGATGSQAIAPYSTLSLLNSGRIFSGNNTQLFYAPSDKLPSGLKWETTVQSDIGIDLSMFDYRFSFSIDYYNKKTKDLLNNVQLPASMGYTYTIQNVGNIQNRGLEFGLSLDLLPEHSNFDWNFSTNISFNRNKVLKLFEGQDIFGTSYYTGAVEGFVNLLREGKPLGIFYGFQEDGYDEEGDIRYKDLNNDGKISDSDKTIIGDPNPNFIYGFNSQLRWKRFGLSFFIQGTQGNDIFNFSATNSVDLNQIMNLTKDQYNDHWTFDSPRQDAKYPAARRSLSSGVSDRFIEDGSYLRLKMINLSYDLKVKDLSDFQLYISGQNLFTITKYSWFDPEINSHMGSNSINIGIDQYSYPRSKSVTFGVRIGF